MLNLNCSLANLSKLHPPKNGAIIEDGVMTEVAVMTEEEFQ